MLLCRRNAGPVLLGCVTTSLDDCCSACRDVFGHQIHSAVTPHAGETKPHVIKGSVWLDE
jgi:hypothetical protein